MIAGTARVPHRSPKPRLITGHLTQFAQDPLDFMTRCVRDHGDLVPLRFLHEPGWVVGHPDYIEQLLATGYRDYIKHALFREPVMRRLLGQGLVTSEGEFWVRQRRLAQPAFHRERINAYADVMVAYTERLLAEWRPGQECDAAAEMMRLTLQIVAKTLFDVEIAGETDEAGRSLRVLMEAFQAGWGVFGVLDNVLPTPNRIRTERAIARLNRMVLDIIRRRRASGRDTGDLLSMLLTAQDDDGAGMSDRQLRDETTTFFFAGHETTALALSWTWYVLATHPEIEARFHAELDSVLAGRSATLADLPRLQLTERVVKESMRLYPPLWAIGRGAKVEVELGGHRFPAGTQFTFAQWVLHRDPRWWKDPETFDPDRWLPERAAEVPRYAYFPFGAGPRGCIGNHFAMMEAVLVLATIGKRYRLVLVPGQEIIPRPSITLRPSSLRVRLEPRSVSR